MKLIFEEERMRRLVNRRVLEMLEELEIDYLGVSIDALLIIAPPSSAGEIVRVVRGAGVEIDVIGRVEEGLGAELHDDGEVRDFEPRFRESAYTPIKRAVDEGPVRDFTEMRVKVDQAAVSSIAKKRRFVERIRQTRLEAPSAHLGPRL